MAVGGSLLLQLCPADAQQAISAPAKSAQAKVALEPHDSTLETPVTITANGQTVQELLQGLNDKTRPKLKAKALAGWQHVTVYARQQPVEKVMAGLKMLLNDVWVRNSLDPAHVQYTLTQAGRSEGYERELYRLTRGGADVAAHGILENPCRSVRAPQR